MRNLLNPKNHDGLVCTSFDLNGQAPTELLLFPYGEWRGFRSGGVLPAPVTMSMNETKAKQAIAYAERQKSRSPHKQWPIDYEHQTLSGEIAPAAAWYSGLKLGSDGLYATGVEWTAKAKQMVEAKEYKYYSPWWHDQDVLGFPFYDKATGERVPFAMFGAGLTNNPFIDEIPALVSTSNSHKLYVFNPTHHQQEVSMDQLLAKMVAFFSLAATATHDEVVAKVNWLAEQLTAAGIVAKEGTVLTAQSIVEQIKSLVAEAKQSKTNYAAIAKALGAQETDPVEKLTALIATAKDPTGFVAKAEFDALKDQLHARDVAEVINTAVAKGKVSPASLEHMRGWANRDLEGFRTYIATVADYSVVPLQKIEQVVTAKAGEVDEVTMLVAKQLNVPIDKLKETAKALAENN